jgi:hypothetical protein
MVHDKLTKALAVIPIIFGIVIINTILASAMGMLTFVQLLSVYGYSKFTSEVVAILVAVAVLAYIWFQPKIRSYIKSKE